MVIGISRFAWNDALLSTQNPPPPRILTPFGWRKEHEHCQVFQDVVKAVLLIGFNEDHASRHDGALFGSYCHASAAVYHIIKFVFTMRMLGVHCSGRQHVNA